MKSTHMKRIQIHNQIRNQEKQQISNNNNNNNLHLQNKHRQQVTVAKEITVLWEVINQLETMSLHPVTPQYR